MHKCIFIVGLISFLSLGADADHMFEFDGGLGFGEITYKHDNRFFDSSSDYDTQTSYFSGKIYIGSVSSDGSPFREAGFLSKTSYILFDRNTYSVDYQTAGNLDLSSTSLSGHYISPNSSIIFGGGIINAERDYGSTGRLDRNGYIIDLGIYTSEDSSAWLSYKKIHYDVSGLSRSLDEKTISLNFRKVSQLTEGNHLAWRLILESFDGLDFKAGYLRRASLGGEITWYINKNIGFGSGFQIAKYSSNFSYSGGFGVIFSPKISYDISENFGLHLKLLSETITLDEKFEGGKKNISELITTLGITVRF